VRGNSIKYLRVPEEVIDMVNEEDLERERTYGIRLWVGCQFAASFRFNMITRREGVFCKCILVCVHVVALS